LEYEKVQASKEIAIAKVNIKIQEVGEDPSEVLFKAAKRVFGAGSMIGGAGLICDAIKQEDQTRAIAEGVLGVVSEVIGIYLWFS
jgi:hypothetical protein